MNRVWDNTASESHHFGEEELKDLLDRAEGDREFLCFIWAMRLSRLLAERGLRDITLRYDASTRQWQFSLRWGFFRVKRLLQLEWSFKAAVSRMGRKLPDGMFTVTQEGDLLTGRFTTQRRFRRDG
jgi:hypothetical protein